MKNNLSRGFATIRSNIRTIYYPYLLLSIARSWTIITCRYRRTTPIPCNYVLIFPTSLKRRFFIPKP